MLGLSEMAVRNAAKAKRIRRLPSGLFDPDEAREQWPRNTDPARSRVRTTPRTSAKVRTQGPNPDGAVRTPEDAREAIRLVATIREEEGRPDDGKGIDMEKARIAEIVVKIRQRDWELKKQDREVVDRKGADGYVQDVAMRHRDAWRSWSPRVAIEMADRITFDPATGKADYRILASVLSEFVNQHLTEMGEEECPDWKPAL